MSTPMSPNAPAGPDDFREQLSAWHDGALPDEASRFVLKRLLGDESLRAEVGRWQVIGDALRRQPHQRPVGDLPARVAVAVAADEARRAADAPVIPGAVPVRSGSLRWLATPQPSWPKRPFPRSRRRSRRGQAPRCRCHRVARKRTRRPLLWPPCRRWCAPRSRPPNSSRRCLPSMRRAVPGRAARRNRTFTPWTTACRPPRRHGSDPGSTGRRGGDPPSRRRRLRRGQAAGLALDGIPMPRLCRVWRPLRPLRC